MKDKRPHGHLRVGLLAADPLRVLGWQTIFPADGPVEIVPLSIPHVLDDALLELILIDSTSTERLFELLSTFRRARSHLKLIVLGLNSDHEYIRRIIGAGANGYLTHMATEAEVRSAIDVVQDGSIWAPRKVLASLLRSPGEDARRNKAAPAPAFTRREEQVLRLLVAGHPNRIIAEEMGIDLMTVKAHVGRLMRKVGVGNRIELSVQAVSRNLTRPAR